MDKNTRDYLLKLYRDISFYNDMRPDPLRVVQLRLIEQMFEDLNEKETAHFLKELRKK